jgi:YhcH/YjgK/YiaL family protein
MGWRSRSECSQPVAKYDSQQDVEFFADAAAAWIDVQPGELAIFFPDDAHAPLVGSGEIHKIVVKVAIMEV